MKRAEGTGSPKALTLISVSRAGSSATGSPPTASDDHPGAGRDHRERRPCGQQMRQQRGVGIVDAAEHRRVCGASPVRAAICGQDRAEHVARRGAPAANRRAPAQAVDQRRKVAPRGRPEIGVAAERGHFVGGDAGEPEAPVLRVGEDRGAPCANSAGKALLLPEELRAEIEADRQARRAGLGEGRADCVVLGRAARRGRRTRSRAPAAPARPSPSTSAAGRAVRGDGDGVDRRSRPSSREAVEDEVPQPLDVVMRIGAVGEHRVGACGAARSRLSVGEVDQRHLGVGLADVDDGDRRRALNPCGRRCPAARRPARCPAWSP